VRNEEELAEAALDASAKVTKTSADVAGGPHEREPDQKKRRDKQHPRVEMNIRERDVRDQTAPLRPC
jgi:hypothetical protein